STWATGASSAPIKTTRSRSKSHDAGSSASASTATPSGLASSSASGGKSRASQALITSCTPRERSIEARTSCMRSSDTVSSPRVEGSTRATSLRARRSSIIAEIAATRSSLSIAWHSMSPSAPISTSERCHAARVAAASDASSAGMGAPILLLDVGVDREERRLAAHPLDERAVAHRVFGELVALVQLHDEGEVRLGIDGPAQVRVVDLRDELRRPE